MSMYSRRLLCLFNICFALFTAACTDNRTAMTNGIESIRIGCDQATCQLARAAINSYDSAEGNFSLISQQRPTLLTMVRENTVDAALALSIPADENTFSVIVGYETLTPIIHPDNPLENISLAEARMLLSGQVFNWNHFGIFDESVQIITTNQESSTRIAFNTYMLGDVQITESARLAATEEDVVQLVAAISGSFAFVPQSLVSDGVKNVELLQDDETPDGASVNIVVPVSFISQSAPAGNTKDFLEWLLSDEGQIIVDQYIGLVKGSN